MTITGYPTSGQAVALMSEAELERAVNEHFSDKTPNNREAIDDIRTAMDSLEDAAKDLDEAANAVYGTTEGNKLVVAAAEIRDNINYLKRLQETLRRKA